MTQPYRSEIWLVSLDPVRGVEQGSSAQGFDRPCLIVSVNEFNLSGYELFAILPITSKKRDFSWWLEVSPEESGLKKISYIMCEQIRSVDIERLKRRVGKLQDHLMDQICDRLQMLLGIHSS